MFAKRKQFAARVLKQLGEWVLSLAYIRNNEMEIGIDKKQLVPVCRFLCRERQGRLVTVVGNDERENGGLFALYYIFAFDVIQYFIVVKTAVAEDQPVFPSVAAELPAANWYEREIYDLLGLRAQGHPDRRPLILHGDWPEDVYPLRRDFCGEETVPRVDSREAFMEYGGQDVTQIPVGPIHAGIIEPGHFRFGAVGDTILNLEARLFYTHRGIEKVCEGQPLDTVLYMAERICGVCSLAHAAAFAQAVETAAEVQLPVRARYLRTVFLELERLYNHIGDVGNVCAGFGFAVGNSQGQRIREELLRLNDHISGHRYLRGTIALGGVRRNIDEKAAARILSTLETVEKDFREFTDILLSHTIALDRMAATGCLSLAQVNDLEVVGVAARASGRDIDVRRDYPYAAYDQVQFPVTVYTEGDALARVRVRIDEVCASLSIIRQSLKALPAGETVTEIPPIQPYSYAMGLTESPRGESVHWLMIGPGQTVYRYRIRSATYSNWPAVPLAVKGNIVPDFPLINKSFELCYACCDR